MGEKVDVGSGAGPFLVSGRSGLSGGTGRLGYGALDVGADQAPRAEEHVNGGRGILPFEISRC